MTVTTCVHSLAPFSFNQTFLVSGTVMCGGTGGRPYRTADPGGPQRKRFTPAKDVYSALVGKHATNTVRVLLNLQAPAVSTEAALRSAFGP